MNDNLVGQLRDIADRLEYTKTECNDMLMSLYISLFSRDNSKSKFIALKDALDLKQLEQNSREVRLIHHATPEKPINIYLSVDATKVGKIRTKMQEIEVFDLDREVTDGTHT